MMIYLNVCLCDIDLRPVTTIDRVAYILTIGANGKVLTAPYARLPHLEVVSRREHAYAVAFLDDGRVHIKCHSDLDVHLKLGDTIDLDLRSTVHPTSIERVRL